MSLELASWGLVLLAIADWGATWKLVRAAIVLKETSLEERATVSVILSICASIAGLLSVAYLAKFSLPDGLGTVLLIVILALISLPQLVWYAAYRAGRFR